MMTILLKGLIIFILLMIGIMIYAFIIHEIIEDIKARKEWKTNYAIQQIIFEENCSWDEVSLDPPNNTIECFEAIVDDAMCHDFEFKVDNGKIYFREREVE